MEIKSKKIALSFLGLFLAGSLIRSLDVFRRVDGSVRETWRECDYAAVARNYYREGMNLFYPRIDWRGDGPGFAEMEFPIVPWSIAILYKIFGYHEVLGRILSYILSLLTLIVFFKLARYLLPFRESFSASLFFVLSPLAVRISNALQPEGLMMFCYLLAAYSFIRWLDEKSWVWYLSALGATAFVILVKVSSLHIGFFFLFLLLAQNRFRSLFRFEIWAFTVLALLPGLLWYLHAHQFWLTYGNSLGLTNEYHWISWELFKNPEMIIGCLSRLARIETISVWTPLGGIIALAVIWYRRNDRAVRVSTFWLLAIALYYLIAIRSASNSALTYYHIVTVPAAALLVGSGVSLIQKLHEQDRPFEILVGIVGVLSFAIILGKVLFNLNYGRSVLISAIPLGLLMTILHLALNQKGLKIPFFKTKENGKHIPIWTAVLVLCLFYTFPFQALQICRDLHPKRAQGVYDCAHSFKRFIPERALILASGGVSIGQTGRPTAYNASYMFFWLDRKGFSIPSDQQSSENVQNFIERGASYFVLEKNDAKKKPGFEDEMEKRYSLIAECREAYLFRF